MAVDISKMEKYVSPISPSLFPHLTLFLVGLGLVFTAWFFVYAVTGTKKTKNIMKELLIAASASAFLGTGSVFCFSGFWCVSLRSLFILRDQLFAPKKLVFPTDGYFGSGSKRKDNPAITPFKVQVSNDSIVDLQSRLQASRIGHQQLEDVNSFEYGMNLFTTEIEGLKIHFIYAKPPQSSKYKKVIPLLLVHGWPGNVFEFYKIIPMLVDPQKHFKGNFDYAFEVVAPSIPGYGWSEQPHKQGFSQMATARVFNKLMVDRLNFPKYLAQGGDWGSLVVSNVARMLYGVHVNMMLGFPPNNLPNLLYTIVGSIAPSLVFSHPEFANFNPKTTFLDLVKESGYMHLQATKPDTVGVGLNDSPIGLMAYILEKFSTWTNPLFVEMPDGGLEKKFTKDELLTIVSIYWFNQNILSSQRYYKEAFRDLTSLELGREYVRVPTGYAGFAHDLGERAPLEIARNLYNISHYTLLKDGGHFAAFEVPDVLAEDILQFSAKLITYEF
uniref:Transmembrane protein 258 n=1 Tax=Ditylenchus dipsaci TaxID=166011 RepID=A0A915CKL1_9BILA